MGMIAAMRPYAWLLALFLIVVVVDGTMERWGWRIEDTIVATARTP
ncbi:MAG TPA: hypothetical protein VFY05_04195 [Candidatus Angelobacter sp.]|nr:hypothetical protein [Candidatus Angelobacter sp.]